MVEGADKRPAWAEHPLYEPAVAHFEAEEWEEAFALFSQLAIQFPGDPELQQILAGLRLKTSLSREQVPRARPWMRKVGKAILLGFGAVAIIVLLAGLAYTIRTRWLLPARTTRDQLTYVYELHQLARGYISAGDYTRAADLYEEILSQAPDDAAAAAGLERAEQLQWLADEYDRALALTREEKWHEALWAWRMTRAIDPNFRDVDYWIAFVERQDVLCWLFQEAEMRYGIRDWNGALEVLERLRSQSVDYRQDDVESLLVGCLVNLAEQKLCDAGDPISVHDEVMELFGSALQIRPQDQSLLAEQAVAELYSQSHARLQGVCEGALQELRMVCQPEADISPDQQFLVLYQANVRCGDERMAAGDFQAARSCYEAAMEMPVDDLSEASANYAALVPMLTPTATPRPPTPTPTRRPATPTPKAPTPTATPSYRYSLAYRQYFPNCGYTFLEGTVWSAGGAPTGGVHVKVWTEGWEVTRVTPTDPAKSDGYYDVIFSVQGPRAGNWFVAVVDANGNPLSEAVPFDTNTVDCKPNGTGHQWVIIDFKANY
jgi:tetratricopeptide (TPR) repeat protein